MPTQTSSIRPAKYRIKLCVLERQSIERSARNTWSSETHGNVCRMTVTVVGMKKKTTKKEYDRLAALN